MAHYSDDPPERAEAVAFFVSRDCGLYSDGPITDELWALPVDEANAHLAANPTEQTYNSLFIRGRCDDISDDDLSRLVHISELIRFHVFSKRVSDAGVRHISALSKLEGLAVYSPLITDECLGTIAEIKSLQDLDLQGSPLITTAAFRSLILELPDIRRSWGPHH
jgi:hypothetical protein